MCLLIKAAHPAWRYLHTAAFHLCMYLDRVLASTNCLFIYFLATAVARYISLWELLKSFLEKSGINRTIERLNGQSCKLLSRLQKTCSFLGGKKEKEWLDTQPQDIVYEQVLYLWLLANIHVEMQSEVRASWQYKILTLAYGGAMMWHSRNVFNIERLVLVLTDYTLYCRHDSSALLPYYACKAADAETEEIFPPFEFNIPFVQPVVFHRQLLPDRSSRQDA